MSRFLIALPLVLVVALAIAFITNEPACAIAQPKEKKTPAEEAAAQVVLADRNLKLQVWAAEPQLANPVAFTFDEKGRCYVVETFRLKAGVPDTRDMPWLDDDLACRTVADRLAMYKKYKYSQSPEHSERLRLVWDSTGAGRADKESVFIDGFNRYDDGLAAGVLARKGDVYFACIPDLYRLKDTRGANKADVKESLATGFGVRVQFLGHDLHGLVIGPDGKLYFSVGDRGLNVDTRDGKKLFNPDSGAVLRCDLDGRNMEIIHIGLRNPQELAFDDHGHLFTWDNNSDSGDRPRWVYVVEGGDSGWRCGYQYGTGYHTPAVPQGNRGPWNTEKLWIPHWDGQAAYIVPPLLNFGNGPSGIAHYPGVGFDDRYKDHFFCADFTGGPGGNSAIWTLSMKPKGAAFEVTPPQKFIRQMLPTDCEFGPDGAFYWSDWTTGWDKTNKGRIFRVSDPKAMKNPAVAEAQKFIAEGFEKKPIEDLAKLLEHPHQKVRQEAQLELASRNPREAIKAFVSVLRDSKNQVARLHAVWGLGIIRARPDAAPAFGPAFDVLSRSIKDADRNIRVAVIEQFGDAEKSASGFRLAGASRAAIQTSIKESMSDPDAGIQAAAARAYGKLGLSSKVTPPTIPEQAFYAPLFDLLKANNDRDPYLRHATVMGLYHAAGSPTELWNVWTQAKQKYDHPAVRMGVLLALRKHGSDKVAEFMSDEEPRIVAEAARAIYDDRVMNALPALARLAEKSGQPDAVAFRALAANLWLGHPVPIAAFAARTTEPDYTRAFALKLLADWAKPGRRDPVTGITMELPRRDDKPAAEALKAVGPGIFVGSDVVRREATQAVTRLGIKEFGPTMAAIVKDVKQPVSLRVDALSAVDALRDPATNELVALSLASDEPRLRTAARTVKARTDPAAVLKVLPKLLKNEKAAIVEKQGAFAILATMRSSELADELLDEWLDAALAAKVPDEIILDVLDAAETRANTPKLKLFAPLKVKVDKYRAVKERQATAPEMGDKLAPYLESYSGGDAERGRAIFLNNTAVYCQRCHQLDGQGGDVGPQLNGIAGDREKDRRYLLESIVLPSAKIAKGYETVILLLNDERTVTGIIKSEDKKVIRLVTPEIKEIVIPVEDVDSRRSGPSAMPDDLHKKMTRRELRDVVEFLASLKEPPKK